MGAVAAVGAVVAIGCESGPERPPAPVEVPIVVRDVPPVLSGTIGAQAQLSGMTPQFVSGYGLVVGLDGTGSADVPLSVRAMMEDTMRRQGVGNEQGPLAGSPLATVSPAEVLDDPDTAVVLVQAVIPPAAPNGAVFDVGVTVLPGTATRSLEGGRLYTTDLFRGLVAPGMPATAPVAQASGAIFTNPFDAPGAESSGDDEPELRTAGRILGGGRVTTPFKPLLVLDNPSHARARGIAAAVNGRFPRRGDRLPTARGLDDESVEINIPGAWTDRSEDFFSIVEHLRVDRSFPERWANRYAETLVEQPELGRELMWSLVALGEVALPRVRELYDFPELAPRMAALEAGARLGDPRAREPLTRVATDGPPALRSGAIELLGLLPTDPRINRFLLELVDTGDIEIRVAAYEALVARGDARVERYSVAGEYAVDAVPASTPMIYATLQEKPRVVLFGEPRFELPALAIGWGGRLMVSGDSAAGPVRVFYRDYRTGRSTESVIDAEIGDLVRYFAHDPTPESPRPGLDFTYSEMVGALHELTAAGAIDAEFVPETDRLELALLRSRDRGEFEIRPEVSDAGELDALPGPTIPEFDTLAETPEAELEDPEERLERRQRYVVPLTPAVEPGAGDGGSDGGSAPDPPADGG